MNDRLAAELARLAQADQDFRNSLPQGPLDSEVAMQWARLDVGHTDRLREIIDEHGWPGHGLVGEDGANHAWLLAQHADRQLDFQRRARCTATPTAALSRGRSKIPNMLWSGALLPVSSRWLTITGSFRPGNERPSTRNGHRRPRGT